MASDTARCTTSAAVLPIIWMGVHTVIVTSYNHINFAFQLD